ncbi:MAG: glycosyltransferase [Candidatus Eisenbacteria bacterium]|nr:glycosyltransferase [Candidatus Eisenbacteria bacterium]
MRRLLIVAYYFPPLGGMGAIRPLKLAKYLSRKNFEVFVLAPEKGTSEITDESIIIPPELNVVRSSALTDRIRLFLARAGRTTTAGSMNSQRFEPSGNEQPRAGSSVAEEVGDADGRTVLESANRTALQKPRGLLSQFARDFLVNWILIPDGKAGWIPSALSCAEKLIEKERIDLIFSTSSPFTDHVIGYLLKRRLGKPWIADLRDLWAQDEYMGRPAMRRAIDRKLEKGVLRLADAITVVSSEHHDKFIDVYPAFRGKTWIVPNAFDPEDLEVPCCEKTKFFSLTHTGTVYGEDKNFEDLFIVLRDLLREGKIDRERVKLSFFGLPNRFILRLISELNLGEVVEYRGLVNRKDALKTQRESRMLLLSAKGGEDPALRGAVRAKLYEYLFSGTPVLAMCNPGSAPARIILKAGAGEVVKPGDREGLRAAIQRRYDEFLTKGELVHGVREGALEEFHFSKSGDKLVEVIETLI